MRGSRTRDVVGVPRRVSALPLAVGADPESRLPVRAKMSRRPLGAKSSARRGSTRAVAIGWSSLTTRSASPEDCRPPTEDLQARPGVGERHVGRSRALRVEVAGSAASLPSPGQGPPRVPDRCGGHRRKLLVICLGAPPSRRPRRAGRRLLAHDRSRTRTSRLGASRGRVSAQGRALAAAATAGKRTQLSELPTAPGPLSRDALTRAVKASPAGGLRPVLTTRAGTKRMSARCYRRTRRSPAKLTSPLSRGARPTPAGVGGLGEGWVRRSRRETNEHDDPPGAL